MRSARLSYNLLCVFLCLLWCSYSIWWINDILSVAQKNRYTAVSELLRHCGWLSVRQLAFYHSVMLIYKTITTKYPKYIYTKLQTQFPYNTRLAQTESVRMGPEFKSKLELTERSFMVRATSDYNLLPPELRKVPKLENFKKKLKLWVMENIKK